MRKKSKKTQAKPLIFAALILISFIALIIYNYQNAAPVQDNNKTTTNKQDSKKSLKDKNTTKQLSKEEIKQKRSDSQLLKLLENDLFLGDKNAPVTMIEYASLSCPHCAAFARESFERINKDYIKTGKVKFIFRSFPLNQAALVATMFAQCQSDQNQSDKTAKYYSTIKALFKTQDSWAFSQDYSNRLQMIAKLDGMSNENFQKCINDEALQETILKSRMEAAQNLQLRSAPTFFINGDISQGYTDYKTLKNLIEKKLDQSKK